MNNKEIDEQLLKRHEAKIASLQDPNQRRKYSARIRGTLGIKFLKPNRLTTLRPEEERIRCKLAWQMYDEKLHTAAFGKKKELETWVADAEEWIQNRADTLLEFEDEVPVWLAITSRKKLVSNKAVKRMAAVRKKRTKSGRRLAAKKAQGEAEEEAEDEANDESGNGVTQLRGNMPSAQDKKRVTLLLRQQVEGYFNPEKTPRGGQLPAVLVLSGVHARLNNID